MHARAAARDESGGGCIVGSIVAMILERSAAAGVVRYILTGGMTLSLGSGQLGDKMDAYDEVCHE